ncbi:MAG: UDP-N-acetylmuramate--L-alanine ligase [Bacteroidota bacterium]|jgi:UDP-N-acetylmuramate--alanine ligase
MSIRFEHITCAYFLGIGGIGMSAIARYLNAKGIRVLGYDKTETDLTRQLSEEGIHVHYQDLGEEVLKMLDDTTHTMVVLTPAIPQNHTEWQVIQHSGYSILKRSQVLGMISQAFNTFAVAGTHGKTTTSTLLAHILSQSSKDCSAFLGGISANYNSNLLISSHSTNLVVEADEYDRSFLTLHPSVSIITSTDADHLDIYGEHDALKESFAEFANQTQHNLIIKKELELASDLKDDKRLITYSCIQPADFYATNIQIRGDEYIFDLHLRDTVLHRVTLGIPGLHNIENAVAASAGATLAGVSVNELLQALQNFKGVKRRFEYIIRNHDMVYIDDYAHHPAEINAIVGSVKQMYPHHKLVVVFQPHLYTRTRDFAEGFSESLSLADDVLLLDIYPARELPIPGVSSEMLLQGITAKNKRCCTKQEVCAIIESKQPSLLLTLGAGDIDQLVQPISETLKRLHGIG